MHSAVKVPEAKRPGKNEQLKVVSEEADRIWARHRAGEVSSEEAAKMLHELQNRYASLFDRILAL